MEVSGGGNWVQGSEEVDGLMGWYVDRLKSAPIAPDNYQDGTEVRSPKPEAFFPEPWAMSHEPEVAIRKPKS